MSEYGREQSFPMVDRDPLQNDCFWRSIMIDPADKLKTTAWANSNLKISSYSSQSCIRDVALSTGDSGALIYTLYGYIKAC